MSKDIIENLKKEIKSLVNKDFDLRKSFKKLEKDLKVDDVELRSCVGKPSKFLTESV